MSTTATTTVSLTLPQALVRKAQQRLAETGHASLESYVRDLIEADAEPPLIDEALEATLVKAMEEPGRDVDEIDWDAKKAGLIERFGPGRDAK